MRKQNSDFRTGFLSEAGNKLKNNDYFGFVELGEYACYVIADSITDLSEADSARLAIETVILKFQENPSMSRHAVKSWIRAANKALIGRNSYRRRKASLTVVATNYQSMRYAYLGNTRLRMYRSGYVFRRTADMSLTQELAEEEKIPKDALQKHEERNNLYAYLGRPGVKPYISGKIKLLETDIITLYTKGIWENMEEAELDDVFSEADNEVQNSLDNVEDLLLSRQPENLGNYTFAAVFVNKVYSDPKRAKKKKRIIAAAVAAVLVIIVLTILCVFLYRRKRQRMEDMSYYHTNTIEYINTGNFVRAQEECEKAENLADKLRDHSMRGRLQEYLFVIETVIAADESCGRGDYETAREYYVNALDRARYADNIGTGYIEEKLERIAAFQAVTDDIALGDTLLSEGDYERAEEKYLKAKENAAANHDTDGREAAAEALDHLYTEWARAEEEQRQAAAEQAGKEVSAAELAAKGDQACLERDFVGANVYYTMALAGYTELEDEVNAQYIRDKMASVEAKLSELEAKRETAKSCEQQGVQYQESGDFFSAKAQYLQAKNLYLELGDDAAVERAADIIDQLDVMIGQQ